MNHKYNNTLTFKIENETDLHVKVVSFLEKRFPYSIFVPPLGENQDIVHKRINSFMKGYLRGSPDLIINNLHKHYTGFCIEFKSPNGRGVLTPDQSMLLRQYQNNGFKTLVSNDYDYIIKQIIEYFRDVRHFHQPDHSVDDMRVQILEKVYHSSENPTLLTSLRRTRELFWIKELGTAKPYGFNDQIKGVGTLSSISCKKTNIYSLFNKQPRQKRSHGKRCYNKRAPQPDVTMSTLVDLVDMTEKPEGVHKINTKLFSISFPQLRCLQELALESTNFDYSSAEYRVIAIILDIANFRLFRPVRSDVPAENPKHFMKIKFFNKAVDVINLPALLRSTSVTNKIPVYFRDKEPPIVSYEYTSTVASKLFNFSPALSNLNVSEYFSNPQTCQCKESLEI